MVGLSHGSHTPHHVPVVTHHVMCWATRTHARLNEIIRSYEPTCACHAMSWSSHMPQGVLSLPACLPACLVCLCVCVRLPTLSHIICQTRPEKSRGQQELSRGRAAGRQAAELPDRPAVARPGVGSKWAIVRSAVESGAVQALLLVCA